LEVAPKQSLVVSETNRTNFWISDIVISHRGRKRILDFLMDECAYKVLAPWCAV
jgi:hypothetical protein